MRKSPPYNISGPRTPITTEYAPNVTAARQRIDDSFNEEFATFAFEGKIFFKIVYNNFNILKIIYINKINNRIFLFSIFLKVKYRFI